jgi:hypothetical protein
VEDRRLLHVPFSNFSPVEFCLNEFPIANRQLKIGDEFILAAVCA